MAKSPSTTRTSNREAAIPVEFWKECMAIDPSSTTRNPPSLHAPNGVLEDSIRPPGDSCGARRISMHRRWSSQRFETWSFPEDREGLMRDLVHAPVKRSVLFPNATHFVLFEKHWMEFFEAILKFLKE